MGVRHSGQILSGSALKVLAMVSMLVDHLAMFVWSRLPAFQEVLFTVRSHEITPYMLCRMFGRLAFPIFAFLIVEGFLHTRDRRRYGISLLVFAFLSEIPWNLVWGGSLFFPKQNVMFTLLLGYLGLCALERFKDDARYLWGSLIGLFVIAFFLRADYGFTGYAFILMLYALRRWPPVQAVVGCAMLPMRWVAGLAFIPINLYNGKRGFIQGPVGKYLFYAFYPVHLFLIWLLPLVF